MLRTFWYGGQVHWGDRRDDYSAIMEDPWTAGTWEIEARKAAVELAQFYLGFALLVDRALTASALQSGDERSAPGLAATAEEAE